jgi:hypothetical protein
MGVGEREAILAAMFFADNSSNSSVASFSSTEGGELLPAPGDWAVISDLYESTVDGGAEPFGVRREHW